MKLVFVNGTHGLQVSYSGRGVVKGINFSANGTAVIVPKTNGGANLSGHADIITADGEKGSYTFHAVGHIGFAKGPVPTKGNITHILANGPISDNGTAVFHSNSNSKLRMINGLVAAYKRENRHIGK